MIYIKCLIFTMLILLSSEVLAHNKILEISKQVGQKNLGQEVFFINQNSDIKAYIKDKAIGQILKLNIKNKGDNWSLDLQSFNRSLKPGIYKKVTKYPLSTNPDVNIFRISKNGRSCNQLAAELEIKEILIIDNKLEVLEASFFQGCKEQKLSLRGFISYNKSISANNSVEGCHIKFGDEFSAERRDNFFPCKKENSKAMDLGDESTQESDLTISGQVTANVIISNSP